ncbi:hypothetical protein OKW21_003555 [Catalinimonas alkaloidigena]|uniref:hypothetical protein n=1 Tax=Catalinimonas alkaloidigena TaxID=1075417 RepID=UPI002404FBE4|nr:hypothetical protein [Catalinimonas alkaloidigena]MDF9798292.1 hypothetical protein [Catalinimonas alkaloidigena]
MTETSNYISEEHHERAHLTLDEHNQPKLHFEKFCLEAVTIVRSINGGEWKTLAKNVRSPYIDQTAFQANTHVKYRIHFGRHEEEAFELNISFSS